MQPYFFPYLGYFQLIQAVDTFVFYDDVNFIKNGWINRNRIIVNGHPSYITVPLSKATPNKTIQDVTIKYQGKWQSKMLRGIELAYKKAPYFKPTSQLAREVILSECSSIADLAILSVIKVANELDLSVRFKRSSTEFADTKQMGRADRLINICKENGGVTYINPSGGKNLYNKEYFKEHNLELQFIEINIPPYQQYGNKFQAGLSILDVMMFCSPMEVKDMINSYEIL